MTSDAKRYIRQIFDEAEDYDRDVGFFAAFGRHLVGESGVGSAERVLDLCCGRGASLVPAARRIGAQGKVMGVDLSPEMVRRTNEALADEGLADRTGAVVGDIDALEFEEAEFDCVLCGFGVFFSADVPAMLAGVRRVLRPNGRFVFSLFAGPPLWPWLFDVIASRADETASDEHPMWRVDNAAQQLRTAGFSDPTRREVTETVIVPSADALWNQLWSLGTRPVLEQMDPATRQLVRDEIAERLEAHRVDGGFVSTSTATILVARRDG